MAVDSVTLLKNFEPMKIDDIEAVSIPVGSRGSWFACVSDCSLGGHDIKAYDYVLIDCDTAEVRAVLKVVK